MIWIYYVFFFGRNQYIEGANYKVAKNKIQEKKQKRKQNNTKTENIQ